MEVSLKDEVIDIQEELSKEQRGWALREPIYTVGTAYTPLRIARTKGDGTRDVQLTISSRVRLSGASLSMSKV
jgi:hypothetical protein